MSASRPRASGGGLLGRAPRLVACAGAAGWVVSLGPGPVLAAIIPSAEKLAGAVAEANRKAGRAKPLLLDVSLRLGEAPPSAAGTLAVHPTGLARLELRGEGGVERHLLQGNHYAASRDGALLGSPRPLLPPLFLLQADTGASLRAALASFGVAASEARLGLVDDRDCYVLGGRAPRPWEDREQAVPSLSVEVGTFEVVAVERGDGVRYRFGPSGTYDGIRMPRWIEILSPGEPTARLEIVRVAQADAPAAAFGTEWLSVSPVSPSP